jgi:uncharacterized protein (DUF433 family)
MVKTIASLGKGIVSNPKLLRGEPIIEGTKTPVRAIAELWNQGMTVEEIPNYYPHITLLNALEALHYYLEHKAEIDDYIERNHIPEEWHGMRYNPKTRTLEKM